MTRGEDFRKKKENANLNSVHPCETQHAVI